MSQLLVLDFWIFVLVMAGIYAIFALGLQFQYGVAGLMNFGHVGMMALSSYSMAILVIKLHWNLWIAIVAGVAVAALGGAVLGLTTLRVRGDYFAIVTIAFSEIIRLIAYNQDGLTGGANGTIAINPAGDGFYAGPFDSFLNHVGNVLHPILGSRVQNRDTRMVFVVWIVAIILMIAVSRLEATPFARVLRSLREDDHVPAALGKDVFRFRLYALIIGSILAGIAGIFWAMQFTLVAPVDFESTTTFYAWIVMILGGATLVRGVPLGAIVFSFLFAGTRFFSFPPFSWFTDSQRSYLRLMIIGVILIYLMFRRPQGILGNREEMVLE
jgi:ABC-type branched-subunit amino acid transport system permease subunit